MSEDLTHKLPRSDSEMLNLILTSTRNLETRFGNLESRVGTIDSRLQSLEQKVEERLYDTRPICHKVVADIAELQAGQQRLEERIRDLSSTVRDVNRDQIVINDAVRRLQLDFHVFDERLHRLFVDRNQQNSST